MSNAMITEQGLADFRSGNAQFDLLYSRVNQHVETYADRRRTVKRRAAYASLGTTGGAGVTTLLLGLRETFGPYQKALVTTAFILSAAGTLLAVWDRHFKHAALWVQRTIVLNSLQQLRFDMAMHAVGRTEEVEEEAIVRFADTLRAIENGDINTWLIIRSDITPVAEIDPRRTPSLTTGAGSSAEKGLPRRRGT